MFTEDLFDAICLCNAGLTQDAPEMPSYYLNQVLNYLHGYLPVSKRALVDEYLAEKKYLATSKLDIRHDDCHPMKQYHIYVFTSRRM